MLSLKKCENCNKYTLEEKCRNCNISTSAAHPAKFSIEDKYAKYRRIGLLERLKNKGSE